MTKGAETLMVALTTSLAPRLAEHRYELHSLFSPQVYQNPTENMCMSRSEHLSSDLSSRLLEGFLGPFILFFMLQEELFQWTRTSWSIPRNPIKATL
ncbi:uncharacterized protein BDV17DRAFT_23139 [Aspergillus undulatus]|uniref:uncharacterized protein n=1 Tax=Aspergillus undulatus TaxID=1810928 RepID=UPI003CCD9435